VNVSIERLAVSSIGWLPEESGEMLRLLRADGITGLEIAPTTIWPDPTTVGLNEINLVRAHWDDLGLRVVALQALLYGRPDLVVFGDDTARKRTLGHLARMCELAGRLGASVLVFGSPRNRRTGGRPVAEVERIARRFFRAAGRAAADHGAVLCIEPNAASYGTDFVTNLAEARRLVDSVDHAGFGLHLDAGALAQEGPGQASELAAVAHDARHFHISEPGLVEFGSSGLDHAWIASAIASAGYDGWRSIEMAADPAGGNPARIRRAMAAARRVYG
jgi:D-psicose/D-tagatose/L-ribulose 3-epimerase